MNEAAEKIVPQTFLRKMVGKYVAAGMRAWLVVSADAIAQIRERTERAVGVYDHVRKIDRGASISRMSPYWSGQELKAIPRVIALANIGQPADPANPNFAVKESALSFLPGNAVDIFAGHPRRLLDITSEAAAKRLGNLGLA